MPDEMFWDGYLVCFRFIRSDLHVGRLVGWLDDCLFGWMVSWFAGCPAS